MRACENEIRQKRVFTKDQSNRQQRNSFKGNQVQEDDGTRRNQESQREKSKGKKSSKNGNGYESRIVNQDEGKVRQKQRDYKIQNSNNQPYIYKWLVMIQNQEKKQGLNKEPQQTKSSTQSKCLIKTNQRQDIKRKERQSERQYKQTILRYPIIELQKIKNRNLIKLKTDVEKLRYFSHFMTDKLYLDFNDDGKGPKINKQQAAKRVCQELEKLHPTYFHLLLDRQQGGTFKPYDCLLLKLRLSPYQQHSYFMNFHDLQSLIKLDPEPPIDSIEFYMKQVRNTVFLEPTRQKMQQDAQRKWEEFKQLQTDPQLSREEKFIKRFTEFPSESEVLGEADLQEALYSIDDLEIDFGGFDEDEEVEDQLENKHVRQVRQNIERSFARFDELQREMWESPDSEQETETPW